MPLLPDQIIAGKYQLIRRLARGGMGAVWSARHTELETELALKFLRSDQALGHNADERFKKEARAAAVLKSPHVCHIYDYGLSDGEAYIAMELLHGEDLETYLERQGRVGLSEALWILQGAAKGIVAAHEAGLVHRDIKPSNLFLANESGERVVKVLDFGIAKEAETGHHTTGGMIWGSPAYMSPEQARGGVVDMRSDVWSLGAVLFRLITGEAPFEGANANDLVVRLCTEQVRLPSTVNGDLAEGLDEFIMRVLNRDAKARPQTVREFIAELSDLSASSGERAASGGAPAPATFRQSQGRSTETAPLLRSDYSEPRAPVAEMAAVNLPQASTEPPQGASGESESTSLQEGNSTAGALSPSRVPLGLILGALSLILLLLVMLLRPFEPHSEHTSSGTEAELSTRPSRQDESGDALSASDDREPQGVPSRTMPASGSADPSSASTAGAHTAPRKESKSQAPQASPAAGAQPRPRTRVEQSKPRTVQPMKAADPVVEPEPARDPVFGLPVESP